MWDRNLYQHYATRTCKLLPAANLEAATFSANRWKNSGGEISFAEEEPQLHHRRHKRNLGLKPIISTNLPFTSRWSPTYIIRYTSGPFSR